MSTPTDTQVAPRFEDPAKQKVFDALGDEFAQGAVINFNNLVGDFNAVLGKIEAIGGDPQALLENLRETSENNDVVTIRARIEELEGHLFKLEEARDTILKAEVEAIRAESASEIDALNKQKDEMAPKLAAARNYVKKLYGAEAVDLLTEQRKQKTAGASGQTGVRRIRNRSWTVVRKDPQTGDPKPTLHDNASGAAKDLETDTGKLQEAFFKAAGGEKPEQWSESSSVILLVKVPKLLPNRRMELPRLLHLVVLRALLLNLLRFQDRLSANIN